MAESGKDEVSAAGVLQFDRVESPADPGTAAPPLPPVETAPRLACQTCGQPIADVYFEVAGKVSCAACHDLALAEWNRGTPASRLLRAFLLGSGAGLLGCLLYYAVLKLTGYEFGLIAILIGYAVGIAVRKGSRGRGGWAYQLVAVGLTYAAIVFSYLPLILEEFNKPITAAEAAVPASEAAAPGAPADAAAPASDAPPAEPMNVAAAVVVLIVLALAMPFLAGFENILGILIIGFGLWEAWRLNRRQEWHAAGPFRATAAAAT
jgi:hypothetical protein